MNQQVNLYHPMFRRQRRVLSGLALVQSLAVVLAGLLALYGFGAWQVRGLRAEVRALEGQRTAAAERLVKLEQSVPQRSASRLLAAEIERMEHQLVERRELLATLQERLAGAELGFSGFLEGLARQRVDGLWLTGLRIAEGGRQLELSGSALRPELVPVLVQRLSHEPSFAGLGFRRLRIRRDDEAQGRVDFVLRTTPPAEGRKR